MLQPIIRTMTLHPSRLGIFTHSLSRRTSQSRNLSILTYRPRLKSYLGRLGATLWVRSGSVTALGRLRPWEALAYRLLGTRTTKIASVTVTPSRSLGNISIQRKTGVFSRTTVPNIRATTESVSGKSSLLLTESGWQRLLPMGTLIISMSSLQEAAVFGRELLCIRSP